jgi:hypothetical protein
VKVVDDETVAREEDELGVFIQSAADKKQVGWWGPAVAGKGESTMSAAAETAAVGWCEAPVEVKVRTAAAQSTTIVILGWA